MVSNSDHFNPLDRASVPAAVEMDPQSGLEEFKRVEQQLQQRFEDTQPVTRPLGWRPAAERTLSAPVPPARADRSVLASGASLDVADAMVLCRRFGRVAPRGTHWAQLLESLAQAAGERPPAPTEVELEGRSKLLQRIALRDVLDWAYRRQLLGQVASFLETVPESGWVHMDG